jgi:hypothetical protein
MSGRALPKFNPVLLALPAFLVSSPALAEGGWPDLSQPTTSAVPRPSDSAVIIGIQDYDHLLDVPGAAATARAWHRWFEQSLGVPSSNLRILLDEEATPEAMATAVTGAALEIEPGATLWFIYIGQASPSCGGRDALFFAPDAGPEATGFIKGAFTWSSLEGLLEMGSHQQAIMLIDASINERDRSLDKLGCEMVPVMPPLELVPSHRSVLVTAAQPDEFAGSLYGTDLPAFSTLMLGALRGWADSSGDGQVTTTEAVTWVHDVLRATERRLPQTPQIHGAGADSVLVGANLPSPALVDMLYEVAREQTQARAESLDWTPPEPMGAPLEPAATTEGSAQASHDQITGEMRHLSRRNAWKGVEQAFLDLESLAPQGVLPTAEDLGMGAQAARALGKVDQVLQRLEALEALEPSAETRQWLGELTRSYGQVVLRDRSGGASLTAARMPMAPDQRAAIDAAVATVAETGRFEGRLPWGVYSFGERTFMVVPGERALEITLRRR